MQSTNSLDINKPLIVRSHDVQLDSGYAQWIIDLKQRYRSAQAKAAVRVNSEKLLFNWELGRDLVQKKAEERLGAGVVEQVSLDLRREFPDDDGFSARNLWAMKKWYVFYTVQASSEELQQLVRDLDRNKLYQLGREKLHQAGAEMTNIKLHQVGAEFPLAFACGNLQQRPHQGYVAYAGATA